MVRISLNFLMVFHAFLHHGLMLCGWAVYKWTDFWRWVEMWQKREWVKCIISSSAPQNDMNVGIVLPGTHCSARPMRLKTRHLLQPTANLLIVRFIGRNFIPSKILSSNIISYNFINNANGIFKLWGFYRSCPSAGNKQSIHVVSFPAGRTRSRPSARHTI